MACVLPETGGWGTHRGVSALVAALYRHPVKGFTPEPLDRVSLTAGQHFPGDRMYAVEVGPSGFDPDAPDHVSKMKFAVLARIAAVARVRTRWDAAKKMVVLEDIQRFPAECVNPPANMKSEDWLKAGFPGAKC